MTSNNSQIPKHDLFRGAKEIKEEPKSTGQQADGEWVSAAELVGQTLGVEDGLEFSYISYQAQDIETKHGPGIVVDFVLEDGSQVKYYAPTMLQVLIKSGKLPEKGVIRFCYEKLASGRKGYQIYLKSINQVAIK